ncbi:MAG: hypothetical protein ACRC11_08150 [Xenococcaceae cyanobacterium]
MKKNYKQGKVASEDDSVLMGEFDRQLETWGYRIPDSIQEALVFVCDTLSFCYAIGPQVFGEYLTVEQTIQIYDRVINRLEGKDITPSDYAHKQMKENEKP